MVVYAINPNIYKSFFFLNLSGQDGLVQRFLASDTITL